MPQPARAAREYAKFFFPRLSNFGFFLSSSSSVKRLHFQGRGAPFSHFFVVFLVCFHGIGASSASFRRLFGVFYISFSSDEVVSASWKVKFWRISEAVKRAKHARFKGGIRSPFVVVKKGIFAPYSIPYPYNSIDNGCLRLTFLTFDGTFRNFWLHLTYGKNPSKAWKSCKKSKKKWKKMR